MSTFSVLLLHKGIKRDTDDSLASHRNYYKRCVLRASINIRIEEYNGRADIREEAERSTTLTFISAVPGGGE
jgi:hypothetical protein